MAIDTQSTRPAQPTLTLTSDEVYVTGRDGVVRKRYSINVICSEQIIWGQYDGPVYDDQVQHPQDKNIFDVLPAVEGLGLCDTYLYPRSVRFITAMKPTWFRQWLIKRSVRVNLVPAPAFAE